MDESAVAARRKAAIRERRYWHGADAHERRAHELYDIALSYAIDRTPGGSWSLIRRTSLALLQSATLLAEAEDNYSKQQKGLKG